MGGDLVEEDQRRLAGEPRRQPRLSQDQADEQRLLLAGRAGLGRRLPGSMADAQVGADAGRTASAQQRRPAGVRRRVRRRTAPRRQLADRPSSMCSSLPSSAISAAGNGAAPALSAISATASPAHSRRAAAMATASSAISRSTASSQRASGDGSASRRLRPRMAFSKALTRVPCARSMASTARSRKRRRSDAGPVNRPSIAGVSQTTRKCSSSASGERAGARFTLTLRRPSGPSGVMAMPVPSSTSPAAFSTVAATAHAPSPGFFAISVS